MIQHGMLAPVSDSCSVHLLICHTCQVDGLSYWILTNVCSTSERGNYFVYIQKKKIIKLFTCERNGSNKQRVALYVVYLVQYLQFVSVALKLPQNLEVLKLVFNKFGVLWQPHWLCVLFWTFTANFTPPHTQYEISCWHIPCWSPAMLVYAGFSSRDDFNLLSIPSSPLSHAT